MKKIVYPIFFTIIVSTSCEMQEKKTDSKSDKLVSTVNADSDVDKEFIKEISLANNAEIEFGKAASSKSSNTKIKSFGQQMVKEHTQAQNELKKLAKTKNITISDSIDPQHMKLKQKTTKLTSKEFDKEYIQSQVEDHQKVLKIFQNEIKNGKDKDVVEFAKKNIHHIEMHLEEAKKLQDSMTNS